MEQKRPAARVQQGFLHGAFILMFGVLLVKAIGALFKIPLSSIITEDGMGYFSTAYSFFNVLFSLSTVGFPVAVARLTAAEDALGHFRDVRQIKAAALPVRSPCLSPPDREPAEAEQAARAVMTEKVLCSSLLFCW